ncbi:hypothetical protein ACFQMM_08475 [Saliphagus sp. GCM10025308]
MTVESCSARGGVEGDASIVASSVQLFQSRFSSARRRIQREGRVVSGEREERDRYERPEECEDGDGSDEGDRREVIAT